MRAAALAAAFLLAPAAGVLPGARAVKVCAAAGDYWPTMTLAFHRGDAWVACKEQSRVVRVSTTTGKVTRSVRLGGLPIAVRSGFGSIWALDSGTLYRVSPSTGKITRRIPVGTFAAYNIWVGGGSVWVADDQGAAVVRVSPATNRVVKRIPVADGPASMAFAGGAAWVVDHRDTSLYRIELATNTRRKLATLGGAGDKAPERMVAAGGSLWVTGRGVDLLKVDPATGAIERTIEIGASGIDLVAAGGSLWVPTRSEAVDRSGFPTMAALKRVSLGDGRVATVATPGGRLDVHGLAAGGGAVWIADNTGGFLYRVPL
jgi:DNA-binding beta-propeller fold protein YncE